MGRRTIDVTCGIIERDGKYLIGKRKAGKRFDGLWEFPGGTMEFGETPEQCLHRELKEEFEIETEIRGFFEEGSFEDDELKLNLFGYRVVYISGEFKLNSHSEIRWVLPEELDKYVFAYADIPLVKKLKNT